MGSPREIAILGAGALGLTLGLRLSQAGEHVTILEREPRPGGLAAGFEVTPGTWLEKFYHHIFRSDRHAIHLIDELGLGSDLYWGRPLTATRYGGRSRQLDSPGSLLRYRPLPPVDRIRMGAVLAGLRVLPNGGILEGRRAAPWIHRLMGRASFDLVWGPLLEGKFGAAANEVALPWFWARVHDRTASLGYLRGGFQRLYDRLAETVTTNGGVVEFGAEARALAREGKGVRVNWCGADGTQRSECFDAVVSTLATRVTCRLASELPDSYRERFEWGRALSAHSVVLALDRQFDGAYWTNIVEPDMPFVVTVEHTNFVEDRGYGGAHLLYLGSYRTPDDPLMAADLDGVLDAYLPALERLRPGFDRSWITAAHLFRAPFAQPIVTTDYRDHIAPFETPIPGLYLANMFQVYPHDRGQNYSIELAGRAAGRLLRARTN